MLADRRIEDLTAEQFDHVYATKVDGLRNLLDLLGRRGAEGAGAVQLARPRGSAGSGRLAYACANEVLNKTAQVEARRRPGCRVVAINWGPWDGGMVTPGLRKVFEAEGVGLIPLADGGPFLVQELNAAGQGGRGDRAGQAAAPGPVDPRPRRRSPAPAAGRVPAAAGRRRPAAGRRPGPGVRADRGRGHAPDPAVARARRPGRAADGPAPGVAGPRRAARQPRAGVPRVQRPARSRTGSWSRTAATATLRALAGKAVKQDKLFLVPVELRGKRRDGRDVIHSRAEIVLAAALPKAAGRRPRRRPSSRTRTRSTRCTGTSCSTARTCTASSGSTGCPDAAFIGTAYPAPPPAEWFDSPLRSAWVADPLVLDASFQMMILWSFAQHGAGSLPCFAGRYRQYRRAFPAGPVHGRRSA